MKDQAMEVVVIPGDESAQDSFLRSLAVLIEHFYERHPELLKHPERMAQEQRNTDGR